MTISEVLAEVDEDRPNTYDDNLKIRWLSELDGKLFNTVIKTHEYYDADGNLVTPAFTPYDAGSMNTELIAVFPFDSMYRHYLFAMIDYSNGETDRYTNSMIMFNSDLKDYKEWYNSTHLPLQNALKLF